MQKRAVQGYYPGLVFLKEALWGHVTPQTVNTAGLEQPTLTDGVVKQQQQQPEVSLTSQCDGCSLTTSARFPTSRPA